MLSPTLSFELAAFGGRFGKRLVARSPGTTVRQLAVDQELEFDRPIVAARQELGVNVLMTLPETP
jgi:hypothetical protein